MRPTFGQMTHRQRDTCRIDLVGGALAITTPYNEAFKMALKATVPVTDRQWEPNTKRWLVSADYGSQVKRLIERHYGETVSLPDLHSAPQAIETKILDVRYIGAAKAREDGTETAYGWSNGGWTVIFSKAVLLEWFGQTSRPGEAHTLYAVLGVSQSVDAAELKSAWKRMARTWHPDVSREPGSAEQFRAIQEAYQTLSDEGKRGRYDAGLQFEAMSKKALRGPSDWDVVSIGKNEWRSPLRCGLILVEGQERLGRFVVSSIQQWADIPNERGEVLVTSWAAGDDTFTESWVTQ